MANKGLTKAQKAALQAKTNALNAKYRHEAAQLKKAGVLSERVNARKNISRSTRTKINKFRDVLEGKTTVVRAKPEIRKKYEGVLEARGPFLTIPKERAKEKAKISRGLVEITRPMPAPKNQPDRYTGKEREIILPFKAVDMNDLVERLKTDPTLDGLKAPNEQFAFRLDGWASRQPFVSAEEMGDYIQRNYAHLFKPRETKKVVKYLTFVSYVAPGMERAPEQEHSYKLRFPKKKKSKNDWIEMRKREGNARRQAAYRERQSEKDREKRLADQRRRSLINKQRKFEEE